MIARPGVGGSVLVIDQDAQTLTDRRLVAHLTADEPAINARVAAEVYLADDEGRRARALEDRDWTTLPGGRELPDEPAPRAPGELRDARGRGYRLAAVDDHRYGRQTRWVRRTERPRPEAVSLRTVVGALEAYEPVRTLTRAALRRAPTRSEVHALARELDQLERSPLVLNRALREAVHQRVRSGELSLSCIAARCGRGKHSSTGLRIGDTTWLQRRLGVLPEHGSSEPTPWIHTDVWRSSPATGWASSPGRSSWPNAPAHAPPPIPPSRRAAGGPTTTAAAIPDRGHRGGARSPSPGRRPTP